MVLSVSKPADAELTGRVFREVGRWRYPLLMDVVSALCGFAGTLVGDPIRSS